MTIGVVFIAIWCCHTKRVSIIAETFGFRSAFRVKYFSGKKSYV